MEAENLLPCSQGAAIQRKSTEQSSRQRRHCFSDAYCCVKIVKSVYELNTYSVRSQ